MSAAPHTHLTGVIPESWQAYAAASGHCLDILRACMRTLTPHRDVLQTFREPSVDTKVIVASGTKCILIAFRGTASWANVVSDMQVRIYWCSICM